MGSPPSVLLWYETVPVSDQPLLELRGVSKAFGEALARFYFDRHHVRVACLRIGSCDDHPKNRRMLSTWLSPGDAVRLVDACLRAPNLDFAVVYGVSANTRG